MNADKIERVNILGVPVDIADRKQVMERFAEQFPEPGVTMIVTANPEIVMSASEDPVMKEMIASADIIAPDGIGLVYASRIVGHPVSERVTGIDLLIEIIKYLEKTGESIYFLGSKPGVAAAAAETPVPPAPAMTTSYSRSKPSLASSSAKAAPPSREAAVRAAADAAEPLRKSLLDNFFPIAKPSLKQKIDPPPDAAVPGAVQTVVSVI